MIILVLNCRGLARATATRGVRGLVRSRRPNVEILSETKIKNRCMTRLLGRWNFE